MERSRRKLYTLLTLCCSVASAAAFGDSLDRQDLRVHAEIAGESCRLTDPSDPHQILGPNPAHGDCLTALYPAAIPSASFVGDSMTTSGDSGSTGTSPFPSFTSLWLSFAAIAMLVLAGFNSRKRHRQLPSAGMGGSYGQPGEHLHKQNEGSRWNED